MGYGERDEAVRAGGEEEEGRGWAGRTDESSARGRAAQPAHVKGRMTKAWAVPTAAGRG